MREKREESSLDNVMVYISIFFCSLITKFVRVTSFSQRFITYNLYTVIMLRR